MVRHLPTVRAVRAVVMFTCLASMCAACQPATPTPAVPTSPPATPIPPIIVVYSTPPVTATIAARTPVPPQPYPQPVTSPQPSADSGQQPATANQPPATGDQPAATSKQATTLKLVPVSGQANAMSKVEMAIETDAVVANPFDPSQFDLWVRFTSPSGKQVVVPAFWYQDFTPDVVKQGQPGWRARFTPTEPGAWSAQAELNQPTLKSPTVKFDVGGPQNAQTARGFVRLNKNNARYFQFDNGEMFVPIGPNLAWSSRSGIKVIEDYERWFDGMLRSGANAARVWMPTWGFSPEWNDTGLGNYTNRLDRAFELDKVFDLAGKRGIYLMLTLLNHGQFSTTSNAEWDKNPYNVANGGMLSKPEDFVTNPDAKAMFKRRLRYIVARWGYSPNLWAWEWWNELDLTPISDEQLRPWLGEMTAYLKQLDPYGHLTNTSYAHRAGASQIWSMAELNAAQDHHYGPDDPTKSFVATIDNIRKVAPNKPVLMGEHGISPTGGDSLGVPDEVQMRNGIWAAPFLGYAGTSMYWWWDNWIAAKDLWTSYRGLSRFLAGEDLAKLDPVRLKVTGGSSPVTALGLRNKDRALAWVRNDAYTAAAAQQAMADAKSTGQFNDKWRYTFPPAKDVTVEIAGLADGNYTADWYSTDTGDRVLSAPVTVKGGVATVGAPEIGADLALKVVK